MATIIINESTKFSAVVDESRQPSVIVGPITSTGTLLELTDTPSSLVGQAGNVIAIKTGEDGFEFVPQIGGDLDTELQDRTEIEVVYHGYS